MKKMLLVVVALFGLIALPQLSHAEPYVSAYIGGAFPQDADIVDNTGQGITGTVEFDSSPTFGLKGGYWFTEANAPWLGVQLDINRHSPDITSKAKTSSIVYVDPFFIYYGLPTTITAIAGATVTSYTANVLFRSPTGNIRPYAGIGAGWFVGEVDDGKITLTQPDLGFYATETLRSDKDTVLGWQVLAGVDFIINPNFSVFGEYKYSRADFEFEIMDVEYGVSQVYGGVSYHF